MQRVPVPASLRVALVAAVLAVSACGTSSGGDSGAGPGAAEVVELPALTVRDVGARQDIALDSLIPSERPVLLWFWAPH